MRRVMIGLVLLAAFVLPAVALAAPPPPGESGSSPEPVAALLLLAGAVPTYAVYRKGRRQPRG